MTDVSPLLHDLESKSANGYGLTRIPSQIDADVTFLINYLIRASESECAMAISQMTEVHGFVFIAYAERMAAMIVRKVDVAVASNCLAALLVASNLVYIKEVLPVVSLVYHSITLIDRDPSEWFDCKYHFGNENFAIFVSRFPSRSLEDRSIQAMCYIESSDEDGFRYQRTW